MAADDGDAQADAALQRYEQRLARALAAVINVIDPHVDRARRRPVPDLAALR